MTASRTTLAGLFVTLIVLFFLCPTTSASISTTPRYKLVISLDLSDHRLSGSMQLIVPRAVDRLAVGSSLQIDKITINGRQIAPLVDNGFLSLPEHADGTILRLQYQGYFRAKPGIRDNVISPQGAFLLDAWYPAAMADLARFSLEVRTPKGFAAVSEANTIEKRSSSDGTIYNFHFPEPTPGIHLVVAPYVVRKARYHQIEIATYFLSGDDSLSERYLSQTKRYLQRYEQMLGPYPYARFAIVEHILPTGYGMPTFTLLGRQVLKLPFIPETSLGHEVLHSWFGNSIYVDYASGNWCEGLTSYLADHHFAELKGEGWKYRKNIIENYESYVHGSEEIAVRSFRAGEDRAQRAVGYGKAAMVFHMLKKKIGEEAFAYSLKQLVQKRMFKITSWDDIERIFEKSTGKYLRPFFDFWLDSKGALDLSLDWARAREASGSFQVDLQVHLSNGSLPFPIVLVANTAAGPESRVIIATALEQSYTLDFASRPTWLTVDPEYDLFRRLQPEEQTPRLSRLLGDPGRTVVLQRKDEPVYGALVEKLRGQGFNILEDSATDHGALSHKSVLFLGTTQKNLPTFMEHTKDQEGFTIVVKKNPFSTDHVLAQATASSSAEVEAIVDKLPHYGKYSRLAFRHGRIMDKEIAKGQRGLRIEVTSPVVGFSLKGVLGVGEIVSQIVDKQIVYLGEKHNRYGDHLMQLDFIRALHGKHPELVIGMEMFQKSYQEALDSYIAADIDEKTFLKESHYFTTWRFNYYLYRDILQYARKKSIPVIALNLDHKLVAKVAREGLAHLSEEQKKSIPTELDFSDKSYRTRLKRVFDMHQIELPGGTAPENFDYFVQAQILWDETMAETIARYLQAHPRCHMVVIAGNGHLEYGSGIPRRAYRRFQASYTVILPAQNVMPAADLADYLVFSTEVEAPQAAKLGVLLEADAATLKVTGFSTSSGAKAAGMKKGDFITAVEEHPVHTLEDLRILLFDKRPGDTVRVTVRRGSKLVKLTVELS
ncbi:MAG: ChaN family lipoprotein [Deltaproteobacteria bacterium]|nr:ChaN family lipoprotein [Deltaproteobacteria bacterium]MBW2070648.1 ChaN family lipoprotein [Deltaproteobacteria bacterium]